MDIGRSLDICKKRNPFFYQVEEIKKVEKLPNEQMVIKPWGIEKKIWSLIAILWEIPVEGTDRIKQIELKKKKKAKGRQRQ